MAQRRPRVHVGDGLAEGGAAELGAAAAHHLGTVLRLGAGDRVAAFNAADGEFLCRIVAGGKGWMRLAVERRLRAPQPEPDLWLLFAPIKRARLDWLVAAWPGDRALVLCDESGGGLPAVEVAERLQGRPFALLVGPEGGFADTELDALAKLSFVTRLGLGPRVLRAETAALAAVAVFQAIAGDWRPRR